MEISYLRAEKEAGTFEENIGKMLMNRSERFAGKWAIQEKKDLFYEKTSWEELFIKIKQLGLGLISLGVKKGDKIGVLSRDCSEILAIEMACMSIGCIFVPFFQGYYPKQVEYVISHSDPKIMIVSDSFQLEKILSTMATGRIEKYFILDYSDKYFESSRIFDFKLLYKETDDFTAFFDMVSDVIPDDICLLIYTSGGTTGISKGVQFSHKNVIGQQKALSLKWEINEHDVILSYFPWHHSLGFSEKFASLYSGACLTVDITPGFHIETLIEDLKKCKPTIYFGSAKIFNEIVYEMKKNSELEKAFFHDSVKFMVASSSPTSEVMNIAIDKGVPLLQGWGLTETLQYITVNTQNDEWQLNNSGFPIPGMEIMIKENDDNEILVRGITVMKGYYKDKEKTEQVLTNDNWFKTGDTGIITEKGLKILGRKNSIFYLENGEKIHASYIEQTVENSSIYISHCVVFGNNKPFISALIFPAHHALLNWYRRKFGYSIPLIDALDETEVIDLFRKIIKSINEVLGKNNEIKLFSLIENELTVRKGELSSSFTLVRKRVLENNMELLEAFYPEKEISPELKGRIIEV